MALRRTWSPEGHTPASRPGRHPPSEGFGRGGAVWLSPRRDHLGLYFHTLADGYFDNWYVTAFVEAMLAGPDRPIRGRVGRRTDAQGGADPDVGGALRRSADLGAVAALRPDAQPVERLWSWLNWERLSNFAAHDVRELDGPVVAELASKRNDPMSTLMSSPIVT